jgi:hypothetical protein
MPTTYFLHAVLPTTLTGPDQALHLVAPTDNDLEKTRYLHAVLPSTLDKLLGQALHAVFDIYKLKQSLHGTIICANTVYQEFVMLKYAYPPSFVNALVWALAAEIAGPLTGDPKYADYCEKKYEDTLAKAMALQYNQDREEPEPSGSFVIGR